MKKPEAVALEACADGMKLADSVVDDKGVILLGAGVTLTTRHISMLSKKNISTVYLEVIDKAGDDEQQRHIQQVTERLQLRFRKVIDDEFMRKLCDALIDYRSGDS